MSLSLVILLITIKFSIQNSETYFNDDEVLVDTSCDIEPEEGNTLILSHVVSPFLC